MSKQTEALKLALNKAFQLGQRYWSWADSEYSSHWKKADAAKAEFDKLVENTYEAIANDHENPVQIDLSAGTQISKVWWDGDKLMAKPIPLESIYKEPEQPSQQEPFAWANLNTLTAQFNSVNCGTAYRLPGECRQPLYTFPPPCPTCEALARTVMLDQTSHDAQRKPLTQEQRVDLLAKFEPHKHEWHAPAILIDMVEAAHGIKGDA